MENHITDNIEKFVGNYIKELRSMTYDELKKIDVRASKKNIYTFSKVCENYEYQFEVYSFVENKKLKALRVIISIFKIVGGNMTPSSLSESFIMLPNGEFLDE